MDVSDLLDTLLEYGVVWKAQWRSITVAVKMVNSQMMDEKQLENFKYEVDLMKNLRNSPNVVMYMGYCSSPLCLVLEYCEKGSLYTLLMSSEDIPPKTINKIVIGIAKGLRFRHFVGLDQS